MSKAQSAVSQCPACWTVVGLNAIHACPGAPPHGTVTLIAAASLDSSRDRKAERIAFLERKLAATRADLLLKFEDEDDHGVADAAMDCRDIRNELKGLRFE